MITKDANSVAVGDLDGDGDLDVLSAFRRFDPETSQFNGLVAWYENTDGAGDFGPRHVIVTDAEDVVTVGTGDLDGDGDLDVLSASPGDDNIARHENRLAGDADDDGEVQFADLAVLADNFGKTDAVWEDGDFDGDGVVQFSDVVILANNFGSTREPAMALNSSATSPTIDTSRRRGSRLLTICSNSSSLTTSTIC